MIEGKWQVSYESWNSTCREATSDVLIIHVEIVVFSCLEILFDQ